MSNTTGNRYQAIIIWISEAKNLYELTLLKLSHIIWSSKVRTIYCESRFKNPDILIYVCWEISILDAKETLERISEKTKSTIISIISCIFKLVNPFYACIEIRIKSSIQAIIGYSSSKRLCLSTTE